jgi:hypothetical protein
MTSDFHATLSLNFVDIFQSKNLGLAKVSFSRKKIITPTSLNIVYGYSSYCSIKLKSAIFKHTEALDKHQSL